MTLRDVAKMLKAEVMCGDTLLDTVIRHAFGADLMSDVLTARGDDTILLTGLNNVQVLRTAEMVDIKGVVLVRGKRPGEDFLRLANELNMPVLLTSYTLFETCGLLYQAGVKA